MGTTERETFRIGETFWIEGHVPNKTEVCHLNEARNTFTVRPIGDFEKDGKTVKTCVQVVPNNQEQCPY